MEKAGRLEPLAELSRYLETLTALVPNGEGESRRAPPKLPDSYARLDRTKKRVDKLRVEMQAKGAGLRLYDGELEPHAKAIRELEEKRVKVGALTREEEAKLEGVFKALEDIRDGK